MMNAAEASEDPVMTRFENSMTRPCVSTKPKSQSSRQFKGPPSVLALALRLRLTSGSLHQRHGLSPISHGWPSTRALRSARPCPACWARRKLR